MSLGKEKGNFKNTKNQLCSQCISKGLCVCMCVCLRMHLLAIIFTVHLSPEFYLAQQEHVCVSLIELN